jgi:myo-inositol-1-phosphate synthase
LGIPWAAQADIEEEEMAKLELQVSDQWVALGKALVEDEALRRRFDKDPVAVLKEFDVSLPAELSNDALREVKLLDAVRDVTAADRTQLRAFAAASVEEGAAVVVETAAYPATYPVTMVVIGAAVIVGTEA